LSTTYGLPIWETSHLLRQADGRFSRHAEFGLLVFNQTIRHNALRAVARSISGAPPHRRVPENLLNQGDPSEFLRTAAANPDGPEATKLIRELQPLLRSCHARVPFSSLERCTHLGKIRGMIDFFGLSNGLGFCVIHPAYFCIDSVRSKSKIFVQTFEHIFSPMAGRLGYSEDSVAAVPNPVPSPSLYFTIAPNDVDNLLTLPSADRTTKICSS